MPKRKTCKDCTKTMSVNKFHKDSKTRDGFNPRCKECRSEYRKKIKQKPIEPPVESQPEPEPEPEPTEIKTGGDCVIC
jgi:hypothetical protein